MSDSHAYIQSAAKYLLIIKLMIGVLLFSASAQHTAVDFTQKNNGQYIGTSVSLFKDTTGKFSFRNVRDRPELFRKSDQSVLNLGIDEHVHWVKFSFVNRTKATRLLISIKNPNISDLTFYAVDKDGTDSIRFSNARRNRYQYQIFPVTVGRDDSVTCFLRVKSDVQILLPITISSVESGLLSLSRSDTFAGLYVGIMVVMLLYNLFIFFASRDRSYLNYVFYIFWVTVTQAIFLGFLQQFVAPKTGIIGTDLLIFSGAMSGIATVIFARSFLRTDIYAPRLTRFLYAIIVCDTIAIIFLFAGFQVEAYKTINATAAVGSFYVLGVAVYIYLQGYKPAGYFLIAWSVFLGSVIVFVLKDYRILPYNMITTHAVQIGSAIEAVLLSFALANKINVLRQEKEESQAQALQVATENERIIKEQNVVLEQKVGERTFELKESNRELNEALFDLKQAQKTLVESEKMASLGQLTAGIAHEINNPINFVTANISPLQRDIDMLLAASEEIESIGMSEGSTDAKQKQIEAYKEELDFDYLKMEIKQLLKGMYEGASRTAEIVKGLRIFSREDDDSLKKANINESIDSTLIILNNTVEKIQIERAYGTLPLLDCYPGKLNQVFLNIITNSIHALKKKFKDGDGALLTITTAVLERDIEVRIKDNATGMEEATKNRLFEPFFTTKDVGEGTGLGMYISYNIIIKHEGEIIVNTELNVGTEFIITLPLNLKERHHNE